MDSNDILGYFMFFMVLFVISACVQGGHNNNIKEAEFCESVGYYGNDFGRIYVDDYDNLILHCGDSNYEYPDTEDAIMIRILITSLLISFFLIGLVFSIIKIKDVVDRKKHRR